MNRPVLNEFYRIPSGVPLQPLWVTVTVCPSYKCIYTARYKVYPGPNHNQFHGHPSAVCDAEEKAAISVVGPAKWAVGVNVCII